MSVLIFANGTVPADAPPGWLLPYLAQATLTIADDGQGFAQEDLALMAGDHFGLSIMSARARRMGGRLEIASQPGEGTSVTLSWPLVAVAGASGEVQEQGSHHEQDTRSFGRRSQSLP